MRESAGHFHISPAQPLARGKVYRFVIGDTAASLLHVLASFAFQTKRPVGIVQTVPGDQSTGVPVNTGIELTFAQDGVHDLESHFRIEPATPGRFEVHDRVVAFVPQGGLAAGTLYTVTVTHGITVEGSADVMADDFVFQFETGDTPRTGEVARRPVLNFTRKTAESATSEAPALETYTSASGAVTLSVDVYRFDGMQAFLDWLDADQQLPAWAEVSREAFVTDTAGLPAGRQLRRGPPALRQRPDELHPVPGAAPGGLRPGPFRVPGSADPDVASGDGYRNLRRARAGPHAGLGERPEQEAPALLAGARVEFIGGGVSGQQRRRRHAVARDAGALRSDEADCIGLYASQDVRGNLLITAADGRVAVVPLSSIEGFYSGYYTRYGQDAGDDYWHYLLTDRPYYLPTDTVRFWGIARPREAPASRAVTVQLSSYSYIGYDYQPVVVAQVEMTDERPGHVHRRAPLRRPLAKLV